MQNRLNKPNLAVYDFELMDSPARIDPNKVAMRQRQGGIDHTQEEIYRRQNYEEYRRNLEEAFTRYDADNNQGLDMDEFKNFMQWCASKTSQSLDDEWLTKIFIEMDANNNGIVEIGEFITFMF